MNNVDLIILLILFLFTARGLVRGFFAEIQGFLGLFLGLLFAKRFAPLVAPYLSSLPEAFVYIASCVVVVIIFYVGTNLVITIITPFLISIFTHTLNRITGAFIGIFKGAFVCMVGKNFAASFSPSHSYLFQDSLLVPYLDYFQSNLAILEKFII